MSKNNFLTVFKYIGLSLMMLFIKQANAAVWSCTQYKTEITVNFPAQITVQRDANISVGQPISDWYDVAPSQIYACTYPSGSVRYNIYEKTILSSMGTYNDGGVNYTIYRTNLSNVGIALRAKSQGQYSMSNYYNFPWPGMWNSAAGYGENINAYYGLGARLIKMSALQSGVLSRANVGSVNTVTQGNSTDWYPVQLYYSTTRISVLACSITQQNVQVNLPELPVQNFTGVNGTQGDTTFTIGLNCDAGARINAQINFSQNSDTTNKSVMALTNSGAAGTASGVGIQMLYGSTALQNNTNIFLKTSSGGAEFPANAFTARYFQTKSTVTAGSANSSATLTLTYQ